MADDLFRPASRSEFPKMEDLEGSLLLIKPSKVENVPGYQGKGTVDRITADVTVFGPDGTEFYEDMYLSQAGIVPACKKALKPGAVPMVLGVVQKFPSKASKEAGINTAAELATAFEAYFASKGKLPKPEFAWGLGEYDDAQADQARAWLKANEPADPFEADE